MIFKERQYHNGQSVEIGWGIPPRLTFTENLINLA
jgi:hypothetical protein